MFFHPQNLKSENNNPIFKPWFNILLHKQSIVCATVDSQCLEYLEYIILILTKISFEVMQFMISPLDKGRYSIVSNLQML